MGGHSYDMNTNGRRHDKQLFNAWLRPSKLRRGEWQVEIRGQIIREPKRNLSCRGPGRQWSLLVYVVDWLLATLIYGRIVL